MGTLAGVPGGSPLLRAATTQGELVSDREVLKWNVGVRPDRAALRVPNKASRREILTAPLYFLAGALALSALSPEFLPGIFTADDKASLLLRGIAVAVVAGIVEELGWTGFAVPTLRRRYGPVATGLIVGVLWGAWHFLPKICGAAAFDLVAYMPADLLSAVAGLTGFRILMVWVYGVWIDATEAEAGHDAVAKMLKASREPVAEDFATRL